MRIDKEIKARDMAKKLNVSISYLSYLETGKRKINKSTIQKIITNYKLNNDEIKNLNISAAKSNDVISISELKLSDDILNELFSRIYK